MNSYSFLRFSAVYCGFVGMLVLPILGGGLLIEQGGFSAVVGGSILAAYGVALFLFFRVATSK